MIPTEPSATIVLVDDDATFRQLLADNLADEGYDVSGFPDGHAALAWFSAGNQADVVVLDWQMTPPGPDVLKAMRQAGIEVPALFLTGHALPLLEETGLALGAVDFVDKAKSAAIILHRVRNAIAYARPPAKPEVVAEDAHGPLILDRTSATLTWAGRPVELTLGEFRVCARLIDACGQNVSYREIYDLMRGEGFVAGQGDQGYRTNVRAMIKRIRQKFRQVDDSFEAIENYSGFGYRWPLQPQAT